MMEQADHHLWFSAKIAGCPIHAVSSHEWAFALRESLSFPVRRTILSRENRINPTA
jgi:hypothetical protein